ncbi:MAG: hypothetical protein J6L76_02485 [Clostridia bacterium]|nr:hypothetical protein [Clostridia bacterium]
MAELLLPRKVKEPIATYPYFPTRHQLYIFRNWGMVTTKRIAQVLHTDVKTVEQAAGEMGLPVPNPYNATYESRGYITVIRNNWHVLPYEQIMETLGWDYDRFAYVLKEEDFLGIKLEDKPDVEPVYFRPLTEDERRQTEKLKGWYHHYVTPLEETATAKDFDFLEKFGHTYRKVSNAKVRAVAPDDTWGFLDRAATSRSEQYVDLIRQEIQAGWGLHLQGNAHYITLQIEENPGKKKESHRLSISKDQITITAVDEEGLLQGLYYLLSIAEQNGNFTFDEMELTRDTRFEIRYVHSYCSLFGDVLLEGTETSYPDALLKEYARIGVNGIWMHTVMYTLAEFPWAPALSEHWQKRLQGLKQLVERAIKYGIKIYLYVNEPRAMPMPFFDKHPELLGHTENGEGCLCTSLPEVQQYITDSITTICKAVPDIGGFFTITASENRTNCYSHTCTPNCPRCSKRPMHEVIVENTVLIARAAKAVNPKIEVFAYSWAWGGVYGEAKDKIAPEFFGEAMETFKKEGIRLLSVSEEGVEKEIGGVKTSVLDYSISMVGPGKRASRYWKTAKEHGASTIAKVQFNNSWECPSVPYLPVLDLLKAHVEGLSNGMVDGLMLGWSLGGYPSIILEILSRYYWEAGITPDAQMEILFGDACKMVEDACHTFSEAFSHYPFHIVVAYKGPQYMGPSNPLFEHRTGLRATMTGLPYDDIYEWSGIFPVEVLEKQFGLMATRWGEGLALLESQVTEEMMSSSPCLEEFMQIAQATYCLLQSGYQQITYNRLRNLYDETKDKTLLPQILSLIDQELEIAQKMYRVMIHNSTIGYEAANHYFFNRMSIAEKVINCLYLKGKFTQ